MAQLLDDDVSSERHLAIESTNKKAGKYGYTYQSSE